MPLGSNVRMHVRRLVRFWCVWRLWLGEWMWMWMGCRCGWGGVLRNDGWWLDGIDYQGG
jgi:hypothetical protein